MHREVNLSASTMGMVNQRSERLQSYVAKNMLYLPVSVFTETEVSDRKHLYQISIRYRCHTVNKDV